MRRGTLTDVFTEAFRMNLRDQLVERAVTDERLVGVALTGSGALGREDRWSDIDIAVGVDARWEPDDVLHDWSVHMYETFDVVDHIDVISRSTVYRVFLLPNTLQVDIAFAPHREFGAVAPTFRLLSGTVTEQPQSPPPDVGGLIGMAWLYALHARSSLARGRVWQAEFMISSIRNHVISLACIRHDLPPTQGRGVDRLPSDLQDSLVKALPLSLDGDALVSAFSYAAELLVSEIRWSDPDRARKLAPVLDELVRTSTS